MQEKPGPTPKELGRASTAEWIWGLRIELDGSQTLSNCCRSDESTLHHQTQSLLSRDTSNRGALQWSVELQHELRESLTEARSVCANMMTVVMVSIGMERRLR